MIFGAVVILVPIYRPVDRLVVLVCPNCYAHIPVSSNFCSECGADLRKKQK